MRHFSRYPSVASFARALVAALLLIWLAACGDDAAKQQAATAALLQAEAEAATLLASVEDSLANDRADLARAFAEDLLAKHPKSAAARSLAPRIEALRLAADDLVEARRLRELWTYHEVDDTESTGKVRTAFIYATAGVPGEAKVRLVLRRHASWGQSAYLLITEGDFACQGKCEVEWQVDGIAAKPLPISRAEGNVPPAVFIDNDVEFLAILQTAKQITLLTKLAPARPTKFVFEVAGFDMQRLGPEVSGSPPTGGG